MGDVIAQTAELKGLETQVMLLESKRILPMESQVLVMTQAMAQLGTEAKQEVDKLKSAMESMKLEIEHKMSTGAGFKSSSEDYDKSIMEYKTMQELDKLNDNKSGFRDWKVRMKDGIVSRLKTSSLMSLM